jgi:hypothetical protein
MELNKGKKKTIDLGHVMLYYKFIIITNILLYYKFIIITNIQHVLMKQV